MARKSRNRAAEMKAWEEWLATRQSPSSSSSTTPDTERRKSESDAERALRRAEWGKHEAELAMQFDLAGLTYKPQHRFHPVRKWRFDFAFPAVKVGIEVDGALGRGKHSRAKGQLNDMEKRNAAQLLGWMVLVFGHQHIKSGAAFAAVSEALATRNRDS